MPSQIGLLLFPDFTQLDLTGPYEVLSRLSGSVTHVLAKTLKPVTSDRGLTILPTKTIASTGPFDVLLVPGGPGVGTLMEDAETLDFLRRQERHVQCLASVCTGALVLGAAGLLRGYRATTHWAAMDFLPAMGAIPVKERYVKDRNRLTAGGVSAGIDAALFLAAELRGEEEARTIQLQMEYDPAPPFRAGSPDLAGDRTLQSAMEANLAALANRRKIVERVRQRLSEQL